MMEIDDLPALNLPPIAPRLRRDDVIGLTIHDPLRDKFVALTPEEWVRQHFTSFLIDNMGYPPSLMANEMGVKFNGMTRRCDTVVYDRHALPWMIVEYKAPTVKITREVINQIARYNMVLHARYLVISNGLRHICIEVTHNARPSLKLLSALPPFTAI